MCDVLQQNDDQIIESPIFKDGVAINTIDIVSANYKLYSLNKKLVILSKYFDSGITRQDNILTISISKDDCKNLRGKYYHELSIVDPTHGKSTVFKKEITFQATVNA